MTSGELLKSYIKSRYRSIREFTIIADMKYTTLDSVFRRGVENSSLSTIGIVCKALGISIDALIDGKIVPSSQMANHGSSNVRDILNNASAQILECTNLTIDGAAVSPAHAKELAELLDFGCDLIKKKSKLI